MVNDLAVGFICAAISVLGFGSNFVPVKKFETGDGVFFQWIMCTAIWLSGFVVNIIRGFPPFQPLAMFGGFLWCIGNAMVVPIVKLIGLSLGLLLWGSSNLIMGWSSGTFGLFGLKSDKDESIQWLNYLGFCTAVGSTAIYALVKSEATSPPKKDDEERLINNELNTDPHTSGFFDKMTPFQKRALGVVMSLISGVFYGVNFDPPTYIMDHGGSQNGLDYVFSHFCGIYITSTVYFLVYCAFKKNKPSLYPEIVLPGLFSGVLWAISDVCWFVANANLSLSISFPIISTGPGVIASLWGIFVFGEIRGKKNIAILLCAFAATFSAATMITLSKILHKG